MAPPKSRLGWLGPAIVAVGLLVGGFGVWFVVASKPRAGAEIDTIVIDATSKFVIRHEDGGQGDRSFVELVVNGEIKWQALIPQYAGKKGQPGIAWSSEAVLVRVLRNERAEVFALSMHDASKLGGIKLAPNHDVLAPAASITGPLTLTDHIRSYEIVSGPDWHQLVAIDIARGRGVWRVELGDKPITAAGVEAGVVWVEQGVLKRKFVVFNGSEKPPGATGANGT